MRGGGLLEEPVKETITDHQHSIQKTQSQRQGEYLDVNMCHESSGLLRGETIKPDRHINKRCALQTENENQAR